MQTNSERKVIRQYANEMLWSDVEPFEVVRQVSDITVEVRRMSAELVSGPGEMIPGGFVGHFPNQRQQSWSYDSDDSAPVIRLRWSEKKGGWFHKGRRFVMADAPRKFHDYNF